MQQINLTIQPTDSDFTIVEGLPSDYGISDSAVLVSFIYKHIQFTAWKHKEQTFVEYATVCQQLIKYAKTCVEREISQ